MEQLIRLLWAGLGAALVALTFGLWQGLDPTHFGGPYSQFGDFPEFAMRAGGGAVALILAIVCLARALAGAPGWLWTGIGWAALSIFVLAFFFL